MTIQYGIVNPMIDIFEDTAPRQDPAEILLAKNEYESIGFAVRCQDLELTNVRFSAKLVEEDGPEISLFLIKLLYSSKASYGLLGEYDTHADYIRRMPPCTFPEYYERDCTLAVLEKGTSVCVSMEAYAGERTAPGTYLAEILMECDQGSVRETVRITVYDLLLPQPKDSRIAFTNWGVYYNNQRDANYSKILNRAYQLDQHPGRLWKVLENYAKIMKKQRQNVIMVPTVDILFDRMQIDDDGTLHLDFTDFDRYVTLFIEHGSIKYLEGFMFYRGDWKLEPPEPGKWPTGEMIASVVVKNRETGGLEFRDCFVERQADIVRGFYSQLFTQLYAHLVEKGWDRMWLQHVADEPQSEMQWKEITEMYRLIEAWMPTCRTIDAGSGQNTHFGSELHIPVTQADSYEENKADFAAKTGTVYKDVWLYTCLNPQGNYLTRVGDYPLISTRIIGWYMYKQNLGGYLHWAWNSWMHAPGADPYKDIYCRDAVADAFIVYPDPEALSVKEGPRATAVRDGFEDYELLCLAAKKDKDATDRVVEKAIRNAVCFERDPVVLLTLRKEIFRIAAGE
jgi:hypothetical protein